MAHIFFCFYILYCEKMKILSGKNSGFWPNVWKKFSILSKNFWKKLRFLDKSLEFWNFPIRGNPALEQQNYEQVQTGIFYSIWVIWSKCHLCCTYFFSENVGQWVKNSGKLRHAESVYTVKLANLHQWRQLGSNVLYTD